MFDCDLPMQDARYGETDKQNSGRYIIRELRAPTGYFLNEEPMEFTFTYTGAKVQVLESACKNEGTSVLISKRRLTGDEELPGATLTIQDEHGTVVCQWVSGDKPVEIRGLELNKVYTLVETIAPNGFAKAESIRFKLVQRQDENGALLPENDVYVCTDKDWLIFDHWTLMEDGTVVMRDAPAPTPEKPEPPVPTPTPEPPAPVDSPRTGDGSVPIQVLLSIAGAALCTLAAIAYRKRRGDRNDDDSQ